MKTKFYSSLILGAFLMAMPVTSLAGNQVNTQVATVNGAPPIVCSYFMYLHTEAGMVVDITVNGIGKWILCGMDEQTGKWCVITWKESNMSTVNNKINMTVPYRQEYNGYLFLILMDNKGNWRIQLPGGLEASK